MKNFILNKNNQFYISLIICSIAIFFQWFLMKNVETNGIWEWLISSFLLFFVLPIIVIKFYFGENLKKYHLDFHFDLKNFFLTLIFGGLIVGGFLFLLIGFDWFRFFSTSILMFGGKDLFIFFEIIILPIILFFQEFLFRGFLLRSAEKSIGALRAVFIQFLAILIFEFIFSVNFNMIVFSAIVVLNLFLGWFVLKNRNIGYSFLINWATNLAVNFSVFYNLDKLN